MSLEKRYIRDGQNRVVGSLPTRPCLHKLIDQLPASEIEIPNAKVGPMRNLEGVRQGGMQAEIDVVEDSRHSKVSELKNLPLSVPSWVSPSKATGRVLLDMSITIC